MIRTLNRLYSRKNKALRNSIGGNSSEIKYCVRGKDLGRLQKVQKYFIMFTECQFIGFPPAFLSFQRCFSHLKILGLNNPVANEKTSLKTHAQLVHERCPVGRFEWIINPSGPRWTMISCINILKLKDSPSIQIHVTSKFIKYWLILASDRRLAVTNLNLLVAFGL